MKGCLRRRVARLLGGLIVGGACLLIIPVAAQAVPEECERVAAQLSDALDRARLLFQQREGYGVVFRRDPMRPLIDATGREVGFLEAQGGLSVQGIIWSERRPLAVDDDELFAEGDVVGPYKILEIRKDGIVAQLEDQQRVFIPLDRGVGSSSLGAQ